MDLGQTPADLIVLSFSDSDLGAFAAGYHRAKGSLPTVRLANLVALKHPLSVDVYAEQTLEGAKGILVRLIGGESYWSYGLATLQDLARRKGIALAVLPADGRQDDRLDQLSTLPVSTLRRLQHLCDAGGAVAAQAALAQLALAAGLYAAPVMGAKTVPDAGFYLPDTGVVTDPQRDDRPLALVTFYRSYLTSADTSPVDAMIEALEERGFQALGVFASSLKAPNASAWLREQIGSAPGDIYIAMHHPPFDIDIKYMDRIKLEQHEAFAGLVAGNSSIRHIFFGHVHRAVFGSWGSIAYSALPAMNHQVPLKGESVNSPYSDEPPMYGVITLKDDQVLVHYDAFWDRKELPNPPRPKKT